MYTLQYLTSGHWRNVDDGQYRFTSKSSAFCHARDSANYFACKYRVKQGIKVLKVFEPNVYTIRPI